MVRAGLIGGALSHSLSPQIHAAYWQLTGGEGRYELFETHKTQLKARLDALEAAGYVGVNVTIPHKQAILPFLDSLSPEARAIGAVNTVCFKTGRRTGHNTDYFGLKSLLERSGFELCGQRVAILGTGGAARCALHLARDEGAAEVIVVSRNPQNADLDAVGYEALDAADRIDVLINTTPVGMHPHTDACPASDAVIKKCGCIADIIYNPPKTRLLQRAAALGVPCANGLWMLVAQALAAQALWSGRPFDEALCAQIYQSLKAPEKRSNIVLIGMPGSGKTTIAARLAQRLCMKAADTDAMVEAVHGPIPDIFAAHGEAAFRARELSAARRAATLKNAVIATGGGIVQTPAAMAALREAGIVVYIDRPLEQLLREVDTAGRPLLAQGREQLTGLYARRAPLYRQYADITAPNDTDIDDCVAFIVSKLEAMKK